MLEESIKLATKAYVFENNVAGTWVTIKSMINNFLPAFGSVAAWLAEALAMPLACTLGWVRL